MSSYTKYQNRIKVLGTTPRERATKQGIVNYNYYLEDAANRMELRMTDVGEPLITDKTKIVVCTMRDLKFNDFKNFDQKVITVPIDTNVDIGCYVMWEGRVYLIIYQQHKEVPTHKTYVIRFCNTLYHCFDENGKEVAIPMSSHDLTLYSNGLRDGKYLDYENGKRKVLIGVNPITRRNIKVGERIFFDDINTFKITSIDNYSTEGLYSLMIEQTLVSPDDNGKNQTTEGQQKEKPPIIPVPDINAKPMIKGGNVKVGMSETFQVVNTKEKVVKWDINVSSKIATLVSNGNSCTVTANSNGELIGTELIITAIGANGILATKSVVIASLF